MVHGPFTLPGILRHLPSGEKRPLLGGGLQGFLLIFCIIIITAPTLARADAAGVETIVVAIHLREETMELGDQFPRKVDKKGRYILMPGLEAYYDFDWKDGKWGIDQIRVVHGQYKDSMDKRSGYFGVVARWQNPINDNWDWGFYFGPSLLYRETWNSIPEYEDDRFYRESDSFLKGYQYKWFVAGKFELLYHYDDDLELVGSLMPGLPFVLVTYVGARWSF